MDFTIPDNQGNQPQDDSIDKGEDMDHCHLCKIDIDKICTKLAEMGHTCSQSTDAGKYMCNYIYYCSQKEFAGADSDHKNTDVIFIHVPLFSEISKEDQVACINDFLKLYMYSKK